MFVNTCGGDQNPLPRRSVALCQKYGHMLAAAVEEVIQRPQAPISTGLRAAFDYVELPYLKIVSREELEALRQDSNAIRARWAAMAARAARSGRIVLDVLSYPLHAWRLGNEMLLVGMGAETVVDYALRFKREFGPGTWVSGYADDMIYIILRAAFGKKAATKGAPTCTNTVALPFAGRATSRNALPLPSINWSSKFARELVEANLFQDANRNANRSASSMRNRSRTGLPASDPTFGLAFQTTVRSKESPKTGWQSAKEKFGSALPSKSWISTWMPPAAEEEKFSRK
jgi:hypothetical protein